MASKVLLQVALSITIVSYCPVTKRVERTFDNPMLTSTFFFFKKRYILGVPLVVQWLRILHSVHEDVGSIPGLA